MASSKTPDPRREQQGPAKFIDNPPAKSTNEALANAKKQVDQAK